MQNDVHGFQRSRKAIQLRTHLSNEALYQQHSDSNGTAHTISKNTILNKLNVDESF